MWLRSRTGRSLVRGAKVADGPQALYAVYAQDSHAPPRQSTGFLVFSTHWLYQTSHLIIATEQGTQFEELLVRKMEVRVA